jgi:hypothetical protein
MLIHSADEVHNRLTTNGKWSYMQRFENVNNRASLTNLLTVGSYPY